jgi:hypothetical protein
MAISGILLSSVRDGIAWARLLCPLWLDSGMAVWPFIRVASRGMVTCTHLACCQGEIPKGYVIHHVSGIAQPPGAEYTVIKLGYRSVCHPEAIPALMNFDYISLSVHLRYLDLRGKRRQRLPSMFDDT